MDLTEEDSRQVLQKFDQTLKLVSFEVKDFHNPWQGLVGEHFTLTIKYQNDNESGEENFFVKTLSSNPLMLEFSKTIQVYEKEAFFFGLLEEFSKYDIDTSFVPKGYFFRPYITVLEDLSQSHKGTSKRTLLDLEHCHSCLAAVARFHASGLIYEKKKEKELGRKFSLNDENLQILEDKFECKEDNIATQWMMTSIEAVTQLIDLLPKSCVLNQEFKEKLFEVIGGEGSDGLISGVLHGDLWSSNFLHKYDSGKVVDTKLVDYQLIKYGFLEQDVAEFLMTNMDRVVREENFDSLVTHYYTVLKSAISTSGLDVDGDETLPPVNSFRASCRKFQLAGGIHALVDHSYTFLPDRIYEEVLQSEDSWRNFLFEGRGKYVEESYQQDKIFQSRLSADLIAIRDLLFP